MDKNDGAMSAGGVYQCLVSPSASDGSVGAFGTSPLLASEDNIIDNS